MKCYFGLLLLLSSIPAMNAQNIHDFKKDSLQFKIYGNITYQSNNAVDIKVTKVFCDYCNEKQKGYLTQVGWRNMYNTRNDDDTVVENGETKKILYIRVAKSDFRKLK